MPDVGQNFGSAAELPLGAVQIKKQLYGLTLPSGRWPSGQRRDTNIHPNY
jgi:hypothetical protein